MKALIYHNSNPIVDRLRKEMILANKTIQFYETTDYKKAMELYIFYKPEIVILDIDQKNGCGNEFLQKIRSHISDLKEVSLSNHPYTKIILLNFQNADVEAG